MVRQVIQAVKVRDARVVEVGSDDLTWLAAEAQIA